MLLKPLNTLFPPIGHVFCVQSKTADGEINEFKMFEIGHNCDFQIPYIKDGLEMGLLFLELYPLSRWTVLPPLVLATCVWTWVVGGVGPGPGFEPGRNAA